MDIAILLALVILGALITRSVWLLGFAAGVHLERARGALQRSVDALQRSVDLLESVEKERAA